MRKSVIFLQSINLKNHKMWCLSQVSDTIASNPKILNIDQGNYTCDLMQKGRNSKSLVFVQLIVDLLYYAHGIIIYS